MYKAWKIWNKLGIAMVLLILCISTVQGMESKEIVFKNIELRSDSDPKVTSDIYLKIFTNEHNQRGKTIFAIAGWTHTANTWEPLAKTLLENANVYRIIAIDMPGHGKSTVYPPEAFGTLTLDDYTNASLTILKRLNLNRDNNIKTIIGHSQGGLIVQMMQQSLRKQRSDLCKLGIRDVILLAPVPPREITWNFVNSPAFDPPLLANTFLVNDQYGSYFHLSDDFWQMFFYTKVDNGIISYRAPTVEDINKYGYNAPEPLSSTLQLIGLAVVSVPSPGEQWESDDFLLVNSIRPSIDVSIFNPKYIKLKIVSYTQDTLVRPEESELLYKHLTGKNCADRDCIVINGNDLHDSIHDLHISDPEYLIQSARSIFT